MNCIISSDIIVFLINAYLLKDFFVTLHGFHDRLSPDSGYVEPEAYEVAELFVLYIYLSFASSTCET